MQNGVSEKSAYLEYKTMQILEISVVGFLTDVGHKFKGQAFQDTFLKPEDGTDCCSGILVMTTNRF